MIQLTVDINLLHNHPDIRDLEQVLPTPGSFEEAAGVRDGLLGVAHEGVLPVGEALVLAVPPAAHVLALESVPLVPVSSTFSLYYYHHYSYLTQLSVSYRVSSGMTSALRNPI